MRRLISRALAPLFGIDTRSLAAGRITLAGLVLLDLIARSRSLLAFYDDKGILPRSFLVSDYMHPWSVSLHMVSGSWTIQAILFIVAAIFASMMLVGYRTRLATIFSWILLLSLHNRNPLILQSGDTLLRMGLFWGMFLPWGVRYSIDAAAKPTPAQKKSVLSVATFAILGQVALIYLGAAFHKSSTVWLREGNALYLALSLDQFTTYFGAWLLNWPKLLTFLSRGTYLLELYGPLLLFTPLLTTLIRLPIVALFAALHLGIAFSLKLGLFAWTDLAMLIFFLPPIFWDWLENHTPHSLTSHLMQLGRYGRTWLVNSAPSPNWPRPRARVWLVISQLATGGMFIYVAAWNISSFPNSTWRVPAGITWIAALTRVDQNFGVFAPWPPYEDGWYVIPGVLQQGTNVNVWQEKTPLSWAKPGHVSSTYYDQYWRKYLMILWLPEFAKARPYYAQYLCYQWNTTHSSQQRLIKLSLYYVLERTPPTRHDPAIPLENILLGEYRCSV
jgi:hypothetical protein